MFDNRMTRFALAFALCLYARQAGDPVVSELNRALASNDPQKVHAIEERLQSGSGSLQTLLAAGILLAQRDMLPEASALFERCSRQYPTSFEAKYNLALAQIGLHNFSRALAVARTISITSAAAAAGVEYLEGKIYSATDRLGDAKQKLEAAYRANPNEENYALELALADIRAGAYVPAIEVLQSSLALHTDTQDLKLELALADVLAGRHAAAIALCQELTKADPDLQMARLIGAFAQCTDGDYPDCEKESAIALAANTPPPYFYYLRAEAVWNVRPSDTQAILGDLNQAVTQMPSCSVCLLLRSRVLESKNENAAAITDLQNVLRFDPASAAAWYRLSLLYRRSGDDAEASTAMVRYRALRDNRETQEVDSFRHQFLDNVNSNIGH